jgi:hypothetical protein
MRPFPKFLVMALTLLALLSFAEPTGRSQEPKPQKENASPAAPRLAGHYEGTATTKAQQAIPLIVNLTDDNGRFSGQVNSNYGVYPITGGTRNGDSITIEFDANGDKGEISAKLSGDTLVGTFSVGGDGGSVGLKKTSDVPSGPTKSATPILILGVYHMANPGLDEVNVLADDVLTAKRQKEIENLCEQLARFQPTKIAIEAPYRDSYWPEQYRKYLAGQYKLGRNEIEQIGFRLAKRMNLPTVYGIDFLMYANGLTPSEMEQRDQPASAESHHAEPSQASSEEQLLQQSTVTQYLAHLNSTSEIQKNNEGYLISLLPTDDPAIYRKADLVANWYKRNLRIFANINRITEPGKDRILVIIGAGHLKLLKEFAADAPYFDEVDTESFLK